MAKKPPANYGLLTFDDPSLRKFQDAFRRLQGTGSWSYYRETDWIGVIPAQAKNHVNPTSALVVGVNHQNAESRLLLVSMTTQGNIDGVLFMPYAGLKSLQEALSSAELVIGLSSKEITSRRAE